MSETTEIRWFDAHPRCRQCGGVSHGILRGTRNESWGEHCNRCANKRLKASEKARAAIAKAEGPK